MAALIVDHQTTHPSSTLDHTFTNQTFPRNTFPITLHSHSSLRPSKPVPGFRLSFAPSHSTVIYATTPKHNASVKRPPHPSRKPPSTRHNHLFPRQPIFFPLHTYIETRKPNQVTTCYAFSPPPLCSYRLSRPRASVECPGEPSDRILDRRRSVSPSSEAVRSMSR